MVVGKVETGAKKERWTYNLIEVQYTEMRGASHRSAVQSVVILQNPDLQILRRFGSKSIGSLAIRGGYSTTNALIIRSGVKLECSSYVSLFGVGSRQMRYHRTRRARITMSMLIPRTPQPRRLCEKANAQHFFFADRPRTQRGTSSLTSKCRPTASSDCWTLNT